MLALLTTLAFLVPLGIHVSNGLLITILLVLAIICLAVWLFRWRGRRGP